MINPFLSFRRATTRPALLALLLFFCAGFADGALVPFFPLWASSETNIPIGAIGLLFGCYAGGELVAAPLIGSIADRIGRRPVLVASSLGGLVLTGALPTGLGCSMVFPAMGSEVVKPVPPHLRGTAVGGFAAFQDLAYGATAPVVGLLADSSGYSVVFLIGGLAATLGPWMAVSAHRQARPAIS